MIATEWCSLVRVNARPDPTRPHPTTMTCITTVQHGPTKRVKNAEPPASGRRPTLVPCTEPSDDTPSLSGRGRRPLRWAAAERTAAGPGDALGPAPRQATLGARSPPELLPENLRYRLKNKLLGPPLATEQLSTERLANRRRWRCCPRTCISSSAYATEQALIPLIKIIGVAAFSLVVPVSVAVIVVLAFVTLSYLEVVKVYTKAGGAYVVARENFGPNVAQVAGMSLLIDYTLTVAVSVAAGVAALTSVFPALTPGTVWISSGLVVLIAYVNLRGVREAGRVFAFRPISSSPTW